MLKRVLFLLCAALVLAPSLTPAAIIANYTFGTPGSPSANSSDGDTNSLASPFSYSGGALLFDGLIPNGNPPLSIGLAHNLIPTQHVGAPSVTDPFFQFTITPNLGFKTTVTSISYDARKLGGDVMLDLYSNVTGATRLNQSVTTNGFANFVINLNASFQDRTTPIVFRLYPFDNGGNNASNKLFLDNVVVQGSTAAVPEPISLVMWGSSALGLIGLLRRRKRELPV
jgi:hypothetical protein